MRGVPVRSLVPQSRIHALPIELPWELAGVVGEGVLRLERRRLGVVYIELQSPGAGLVLGTEVGDGGVQVPLRSVAGVVQVVLLLQLQVLRVDLVHRQLCIRPCPRRLLETVVLAKVRFIS